MKRLSVLMISAECYPFAKTGGLADVVGALPGALTALGHDVRVVIPLYGIMDRSRFDLKPVFQSMCVWMGNEEEWCAVWSCPIPSGGLAYFIEFHEFFDRWGVYHDNTLQDYDDNPRRFAFLTRAALQLAKDLGFSPDIVHAHDWQAATAAAYLQTWHHSDPVLGRAASVLTIHNLAYQGTYPSSHYAYLGLGPDNYAPDRFESHGGLNFLKGGITLSDQVNTVSPHYAKETLTPEGGFGLAPYLVDRGDAYVGIINGVDYSQWDPQNDTHIPARFSRRDLAGKALCKERLQEHFHLHKDPKVPIFSVVSRLVSQKGLDILAETLERIVHTMKVQFVILGNGDKGLEHYFGELPGRYPGVIGSFIGYNNDLSHLIEAGSDFFVMPSRYEPCGLNQIYSLRYGTIPVVRSTGGLDDTVENYDPSTGSGTGFKFSDLSSEALYGTIGWATGVWYDKPQVIEALRMRGMAQDFSWDSSAREYEAMYHRAIAARKKRSPY